MSARRRGATPAAAAIGRSLLGLVDALQRSLFDARGEPAPDALVAAAGRGEPDRIAAGGEAASSVVVEGGDGGSTVSSALVERGDAGSSVGVRDLPRHPHANREAMLDGRRVAFRFERSRRRSIGFVVSAEGLVVRAPRWVALRDVDAALQEKARWITARLDEQRQRGERVAAAAPRWRDGGTVAYLGGSLELTVVEETRGRTGLDPSASRIVVRVADPADEAGVRAAAEAWLKEEARRIFAERVAHYAPLLGVRVARLSLSSAKTRWGSASASGAVRLHWCLVQHPLSTIDYVVVHELAHLREMNHGARFWQLVGSVLPDHEATRRALKRAEIAAPGRV